MLIAVGMWPACAALIAEPSYSSFARVSIMNDFFLLLIREFTWTKSARTFGFGLPLKFECANGLVLDSVLYPSAFHLVSPPSSIATLLCEKYSESHTPLAADVPETSS